MTINGLTTDGSEFTLPDGSPYSGRYHVHVSQGAMVGSNHVPTPHQRLTPTSPEVAGRIAALQDQLRARQQRGIKIRSTTSTPRRSMRGGGGY
tara:strand:+ start:2361 stop:2639 length:279 start_codon:yes stop_codon:yes gene_type:complete